MATNEAVADVTALVKADLQTSNWAVDADHTFYEDEEKGLHYDVDDPPLRPYINFFNEIGDDDEVYMDVHRVVPKGATKFTNDQPLQFFRHILQSGNVAACVYWVWSTFMLSADKVPKEERDALYDEDGVIVYERYNQPDDEGESMGANDVVAPFVGNEKITGSYALSGSRLKWAFAVDEGQIFVEGMDKELGVQTACRHVNLWQFVHIFHDDVYKAAVRMSLTDKLMSAFLFQTSFKYTQRGDTDAQLLHRDIAPGPTFAIIIALTFVTHTFDTTTCSTRVYYRDMDAATAGTYKQHDMTAAPQAPSVYTQYFANLAALHRSPQAGEPPRDGEKPCTADANKGILIRTMMYLDD